MLAISTSKWSILFCSETKKCHLDIIDVTRLLAANGSDGNLLKVGDKTYIDFPIIAPNVLAETIDGFCEAETIRLGYGRIARLLGSPRWNERVPKKIAVSRLGNRARHRSRRFAG